MVLVRVTPLPAPPEPLARALPCPRVRALEVVAASDWEGLLMTAAAESAVDKPPDGRPAAAGLLVTAPAN